VLTQLPFLSGLNCLSIDIDEKRISARGGPLVAALIVQANLDLKYIFDSDSFAFEICEVRCRLVVAPESVSPPVSVKPNQIRVTAHMKHLKEQLVQLEFPMDLPRLAWLERQRKGSDMKLKLELDVFAEQHIGIGTRQQGFDPPAWGLKARHRSMHNLDLQIPRSEWIKNVLPGTGFGTVYLLELPRIPLERCEAIEPAIAALRSAHKLLADGHWQEAVGKCRLALEPFFESKEVRAKGGKLKTVPVLKASWETRLGKATYAWLNTSLTAIKAPGNKATHSTRAVFDETSAQMLLSVTTALVAYAAQTLESDK
jgi:hypothetical protein